MRMRIGYISTYLPQRCGIATYTSYLIGGFKEAAPDIQVRVLAERGASPLQQEALEVVPCWDRRENYVEQLLAHVEGVDLVHIQHEYSIYSFDDRLPTLLTKLPSSIGRVVTIHCVRPGQVSERGSVDEIYAKRIASLADWVIVHLPSQKAILERLGVPSSKISVIPHGTQLSEEDPERSRERLGLPKEGKILLMFGFVKPHKCFHVAVEALRQIVDAGVDARLFVAGGLAPNAPREARDYVDHLERRIEELHLRDRVIFPNRFYPNEDVPYLFRACDVVLFPYYEGDRSASGSLHLAIGAARPIIASRIPKFEELARISDELLVLPHNAEEIAKLAIRLFRDPYFSRYILQRTQEYRRLTSWPNTARKHLEVYKTVLQQRSKA